MDRRRPEVAAISEASGPISATLLEGYGVNVVLIAIPHVPPNTADYRTNWSAISLIINQVASFLWLPCRHGFSHALSIP